MGGDIRITSTRKNGKHVLYLNKICPKKSNENFGSFSVNLRFRFSNKLENFTNVLNLEYLEPNPGFCKHPGLIQCQHLIPISGLDEKFG
jgi:hypothetical protein